MDNKKKTRDWYNENADEYTAHVRSPEDSVYHSMYEKPAMYGILHYDFKRTSAAPDVIIYKLVKL